MARIKISNQENMLEVPNELAVEIKKLWMDKTISSSTPVDLKVMTIAKSLIRGVFLDIEIKEKFNFYDFTNDWWKQEVLSFEKELNDFDGGFDDLIVNLGITNKDGKILNLSRYEDYHYKLNALNYLRFLRKKAKENEAKELDKIVESEINVSQINF